jgi:hypothetical protein
MVNSHDSRGFEFKIDRRAGFGGSRSEFNKAKYCKPPELGVSGLVARLASIGCYLASLIHLA